MAVSHVRLRNTETGGEWDCPAGAVPHWRARGWDPIESSVATGDDAAPVDGKKTAEEPPDDDPADGGNESDDTAAGRRTRKGSK